MFNSRALLSVPMLMIVLTGCSGSKDSSASSETGTPPGKSAAGKTGAPSAPVKVDMSKPEFTFTATEWFKEFKGKEKEARAKYADKVVQITGKIKSMSEEGPKNGYVTSLFFELEKGSIDVLRAIVNDPAAWTKTSAGSTVTLVGVFRQKMPFIAFDSNAGDLFDAEIKSSTEGPTPTVKAEDLIKEFEANAEAFEKKHDKKSYIIEGVVASNKKIKDEFELIISGGKTQVKCGWSNGDFAQWRGVDQVKAGDKVRVYATILSFGGLQFRQAKFMGKIN